MNLTMIASEMSTNNSTRVERKMSEYSQVLKRLANVMQQCIDESNAYMDLFDKAKIVYEDTFKTYEGLRLLNDIRLGEVFVIDKFGKPAHITVS